MGRLPVACKGWSRNVGPARAAGRNGLSHSIESIYPYRGGWSRNMRRLPKPPCQNPCVAQIFSPFSGVLAEPVRAAGRLKLQPREASGATLGPLHQKVQGGADRTSACSQQYMGSLRLQPPENGRCNVRSLPPVPSPARNAAWGAARRTVQRPLPRRPEADDPRSRDASGTLRRHVLHAQETRTARSGAAHRTVRRRTTQSRQTADARSRDSRRNVGSLPENRAQRDARHFWVHGRKVQ